MRRENFKILNFEILWKVSLHAELISKFESTTQMWTARLLQPTPFNTKHSPKSSRKIPIQKLEQYLSIDRRTTRQLAFFDPPNTSCATYSKSFIYTAMCLWNKIPPHMRESETLASFKSRVYRIMVQKLTDVMIQGDWRSVSRIIYIRNRRFRKIENSDSLLIFSALSNAVNHFSPQVQEAAELIFFFSKRALSCAW